MLSRTRVRVRTSSGGACANGVRPWRVAQRVRASSGGANANGEAVPQAQDSAGQKCDCTEYRPPCDHQRRSLPAIAPRSDVEAISTAC
ncbi:hypothetical protein [Scytonema sp. PRP1]|uniref:hypothetical protein n=1 Tax=Scytonema sp. PRP1 TaxID=3120513 RepID=UPI002FCFF792